jgi:CBS domain-containing protein
MEVQEYMSAAPIWCSPEDDVQTAAMQMRDNNVGFIPVLSNPDERKLVGILTDRDVCLKVVAAGQDPRFTRIDEIMTRDVRCCKKHESIEHAFFRMQAGHVRRLPVIDGHERLIGIISLDDMVRSNALPAASLVKGVRQVFETARRRPKATRRALA